MPDPKPLTPDTLIEWTYGMERRWPSPMDVGTAHTRSHAEAWRSQVAALESRLEEQDRQLATLNLIAADHTALAEAHVAVLEQLAYRKDKLDAASDIISAQAKQLAAMREYVVAIYDGNNDLIDEAWDALDADTKKWLERADERTREKYRRKAVGGT